MRSTLLADARLAKRIEALNHLVLRQPGEGITADKELFEALNNLKQTLVQPIPIPSFPSTPPTDKDTTKKQWPLDLMDAVYDLLVAAEKERWKMQQDNTLNDESKEMALHALTQTILKTSAVVQKPVELYGEYKEHVRVIHFDKRSKLGAVADTVLVALAVFLSVVAITFSFSVAVAATVAGNIPVVLIVVGVLAILLGSAFAIRAGLSYVALSRQNTQTTVGTKAARVADVVAKGSTFFNLPASTAKRDSSAPPVDLELNLACLR